MLSNVTKKMWWESDVSETMENLFLVAYVFNVWMFMGNPFPRKVGYRSF